MIASVTFDDTPIGSPPQGWTSTMTGSGSPRWTVDRDDTAPSRSNILKQSGNATFPLALKLGTSLKEGFVEVKFKAIAGARDRAAGIVWRATNANNYYVVRANALEDNVVLYKTVVGVRSPLDIMGRKGGYGFNTPVPANLWHKLRVEFSGHCFAVSFNGQQLYAVEDATFNDAGMIGLWTKADSVTAFDELCFG